MIKTPGSLQDLTQRISGRGKAGAVGVGGVGPDDLVRVEGLPAAPGRINLAVKRAGERSAGNRHAPFDVAGAGNGISHGFTAPVLDPTDVAGTGNGVSGNHRATAPVPDPTGGFFSGGYVTMLTAAFVVFLGMTFLQAVATTKVINVFSSGVATLVFLWRGVVDLKLGVILGITMFLGALLGSRIALFLSAIWLRRIFIAAVLCLAVKLLLPLH